MATLSNHGGSCCGMKHIHTFRDDPARNAAQLIGKTNNAEYGDGRYQLEVILSDRQTRDNPGLIENLARLGYVYTSSWTGQHGTPVHLFLRAKHRLALSAANFYGRWTGDLNGMLPHPSLAGTLPALAEMPNAGDRGLRAGARVVNVVDGSPRYNQEATVIRADNYDYQIQYADNHVSTFVNRTSVRVIGDNLAAPPAPPPVYRHPTNPAFVNDAQGNPRRLILSQFYCVFRTTGQASRVFATLAEAQATYPQALDWHERKVYSDGEVVEGPVQHG